MTENRKKMLARQVIERNMQGFTTMDLIVAMQVEAQEADKDAILYGRDHPEMAKRITASAKSIRQTAETLIPIIYHDLRQKMEKEYRKAHPVRSFMRSVDIPSEAVSALYSEEYSLAMKRYDEPDI